MARYSAVKKARRVLRARGVTGNAPDEHVLADAYYAQIDVLNDAQLEYENLRRDVDTSRRAFTNPDQLVTALEAIDSYLRTLLSEYELAFRAFRDADSARLSELPAMKGFLHHGTSTFHHQLVYGIHTVQDTLRGELLHLKLPGFGDEEE